MTEVDISGGRVVRFEHLGIVVCLRSDLIEIEL